MNLPVNYNNLNSSERKKVREEYVKRQKGKCCHCGISLNEEPIEKKYINKDKFPIGFFYNQIHLHHNHQTGMTIGAVHAYCNAELWQYYGE